VRKEKRFVSARNVDSERSGEGSSGIPSQDSQDLSAAESAASFITEKSSESHSVDVTNKGMVNRYLRVFHHVSHFRHTTGLHLGHTCPSRHLKVSISEDTCEDPCVALRTTETQGIRTASKFLRPFEGHSESAFCSFVTKVAQLIFLQTLQIALTIIEETLSVGDLVLLFFCL
jgi:hypothetical protein